ncbi:MULTISPECIES: hypothetical protein [unclassified Microcoleus]|uniref:hypothetical protein n=1 Tax=unclassified Microcoleus TaxID=2642155 RepID=UPI002FCEC6A3
MKPNSLPTTTPDSQIQENPSICHTEQPHQQTPTLPGLPNLDLIYPSLMPFLILLINMTDQVLVPWIAARLNPQKTKLEPDEKNSRVFNFTFNFTFNIPQEKDDLPKNKTLKEKDDLPKNKTLKEKDD